MSLIRFDKNKNQKPIFYLKGIINTLLPHIYYISKKEKLLSRYRDNNEVQQRVDYYNKTQNFTLTPDAISTKEFYKTKKKTYFFDLVKYLKYFKKDMRFAYLFGDITHIPDTPSILKSRPISDDNQNSVLMKLNSVRHFVFVDDKMKFEDKKPLAIWRGKCYKEHRVEFVKIYHDKNFCDIGQTNTKGEMDVPWQKGKVSLEQQLNYRYLIAIEGNDVASNLKWSMSSNSLVMMSKPKYETWFMEGTLKENYHYVLLKDDYSDLEEKINYYNEHIDEAKTIINNAHTFVEMFKNQDKEDAISVLVLEKYFKNSEQI